jgi:hypothetical protein
MRDNPRNDVGLGFGVNLPLSSALDHVGDVANFAYVKASGVKLNIEGEETTLPLSPGVDKSAVIRWAGQAKAAIEAVGNVWRIKRHPPIDRQELNRETEQYSLFLTSAGLIAEEADPVVTERLMRTTEVLNKMANEYFPFDYKTSDGSRDDWEADRIRFAKALVTQARRWVFQYLALWDEYLKEDMAFDSYIKSSGPPTLKEVERRFPLLALTQDIGTLATGDPNITANDVIDAARRKAKEVSDAAGGLLGDMEKYMKYMLYGIGGLAALVALSTIAGLGKR